MAKKTKTAEFYYRSIQDNEVVQAFLGTDNKHEEPSKKHFHNLMEVGICRRGNGEILINNRKYSYSEGTIMIVPANEVHAVIDAKDESSFWEYIYINPFHVLNQTDILKRDRKLSPYFADDYVLVRNRENALFLQDELNLLMNQMRVKEYGYYQCVWGLTYVLLMEIAKIRHETDDKQVIFGNADKKSSSNITRALDFVETHFSEDIRTSDIAKAAFVSETTLRKLFHDYFEMSPGQYVNYIRIQKAGKLIRHTETPIVEIAGMVGYENLSTFINNFKLYTGETPGKWKEKNQSNN